MDLALLVYGISVLSSIKTPLIIGTIVLGLCTIILIIFKMVWETPSGYDRSYNMEGYKEQKAAFNKWWKACGISLIVVAFFNTIVPSEKTMYIMVGAYAAQKVAENDKVAVLSSKVLKIIESKLDGYIEEAENEVKQKLEVEANKANPVKDDKKK